MNTSQTKKYLFYKNEKSYLYAIVKNANIPIDNLL